MADIVKTYLAKILVKADDAVKTLNRFTTEVNKTKRALKELMAAGHTLGEAQGILAKNTRESKTEMVDQKRAAAVLSAAVKQTSSSMGVLGSQATKTARILERIFAAAIIGVVLNAIRQLINAMKEAVEAGAELSRSLLDVQASARALQRVGMETTVREWVDLIDELDKKFTQFSTGDIQTAITRLLDLGRVTGASREEMIRLINAAGTLATEKGKTLTEAMEAFAQPVATGRTHALREFVDVMRETSIEAEAKRRGIVGLNEEITEYHRLLAVLAIAEERQLQVMGDTVLIQEHVSGKYIENKENIVTLKAAIGSELLPVTAKLQEAFVWLLDKLDGAIQGLQLFYAVLITQFTFISKLAVSIKELGGVFQALRHPIDTINTLLSQWGHLFRDVANVINPRLFNELAEGVENSSQAFEDGEGAVEGYLDIITDLFNKVKENFIDMSQDIEKEWRKFQQKFIGYVEKMQLKLQELYLKLQFNIAKAYRSANDKIAEANKDYRNNEIEAEEKYQEKLRKLREQFLFDLEDALHERDARQIMRLIRQYNLKKTQLGREREQEREENKRNLADEIDDIKRQRDARIRELQLEYAFRKAQMERQFALEQKLRLQAHLDRIAEIKKNTKQRNEELVRALIAQGKISAEQGALIARVFDAFFGPGGAVDGSVTYLVGLIELAVDATIRAIQRLSNVFKSLPKSFGKAPAPPTSPPPRNPIPGMAEGGTFLATKPTTVTFGEAGPEIGEFTPLSKTMGKIPSGLSKDSSRSDKVELLVRMEEGLVAEIVDATLDQTATVVLNVERSRYGRV